MTDFEREVREFMREMREFRQAQINTTRYRKGATHARRETNLRLNGIENRLSLLESASVDPQDELELA